MTPKRNGQENIVAEPRSASLASDVPLTASMKFVAASAGRSKFSPETCTQNLDKGVRNALLYESHGILIYVLAEENAPVNRITHLSTGTV